MQYNYVVNPGEPINLWQMQELREVPYDSPTASFDHEDKFRVLATEAVDMKTIAKIIYPVREAFLGEDTITEAPYVSDGFEQLYFPWANRKVDFSTFSHDPKVMSNYVRSYVHCDCDRVIDFEVKTCGGVKIWVNGHTELLYKSYERNVPNAKRFSLKMKKGDNELLLFANDLAERDVFFYFELINRSRDVLSISVPIKQEQNRIDQAKQVMESIYFDKDSYVAEKIILRYDNTLMDRDLELLWGEKENKIVLSACQDYVILGDAADDQDPHFSQSSSGNFPIKTLIGDMKIQTRLYLAVYNKQLAEKIPAKTIENRKQQALEVILNHGNEGDLGTVLAQLDTGICTQEGIDTIEMHLKRVEDRLDCADFRLPVILLMTMKYGDLLPQVLNQRINQAALNFRYWCDEPGNDVMWFFSENHALLFHVSQYLSGHHYPGAIFVNSGRTSLRHKSIGYKKIVRWFEEFLPRGYDEWNSLTYLPVDAIAFFTLYQVAPDQLIKDYAKQALDITFEIIAANMHRHVFTSSYGRAYEHTLKGVELGELSMYAWIAWGQGTVSVKNQAVSLFATSDYKPGSYKWLRDVDGGKAIQIERIQGCHEAYTYMYKRREYALASTMNFHSFETGMQQHFINLSFSEEEIQMWFNHPGERVFSGSNRPSYWAGWQTTPYVEQYKNVIMVGVSMKESDEVDFVHANIPIHALDTYQSEGGWFVFRQGDAYGAFWFANGFDIVEKGANTLKEIISVGRENAFIIRCGSAQESTSFEAFKENILASRIDYINPHKLVYEDYQHGLLCTDRLKGLTRKGNIIDREASREGLVTIED